MKIGHGYSLFSGLPQLFADYVPSCTYEGDNVILLLQTAGFLIKQSKKALSGQPLPRSVSYLQNPKPFTLEKDEDFYDPSSQRSALFWCIGQIVLDTNQTLQNELTRKNEHDAYNSCMRQLTQMGSFYCYVQVIDNFLNGLTKVIDPKIRRVLKLLSDLFFLEFLDSQKGLFLQYKALSINAATELPRHISSILNQIRPEAVALCDR